LDKHANEKLDFSKLRTHLREKPRTKAGQIRQAWPDIKQLLAAGHSLNDICRWLNEIGLQIGYARLSDYVCQLRRRDAGPLKPAVTVIAESAGECGGAFLPLAHILVR
jgi:hypothetical protein